MARQSTASYYRQNPTARRRRLQQQSEYNKTDKGLKIRTNANKLNRKLGTYGNGDGKDASHTSPAMGRLESPKANRTRPRKGKKYADKLPSKKRY